MVLFCREYNSFVASVAGEVEALRKVQAVAVAEQMALDEASLQRLEAEKAKGKVQCGPLHHDPPVCAKICMCQICPFPTLHRSCTRIWNIFLMLVPWCFRNIDVLELLLPPSEYLPCIYGMPTMLSTSFLLYPWRVLSVVERYILLQHNGGNMLAAEKELHDNMWA